MKYKIKICGITRLEDAILAYNLGAWAIGFIFTKDSLRYISPEKASRIAKSIPDNIEKIGVFVNSNLIDIINTVETVGLTKIQLHGYESPDFCNILSEEIPLDIIKAFRIKDKNSVNIIYDYNEYINYILLDTYSPNFWGGTGKKFDWNILENIKNHKLPIILAGGINQTNIQNAFKKVQPFAFDISSSVESSPGVKDPVKLRELFSF